jgi:3',5'-cyclic AMP phosphodiesterase CpdA
MGEIVKIGVCADVHHDLMPDAMERLKAFIDEMNREKADFILQLGDFCHPAEKNRPFLEIWNSFRGPRYHVLGNHDKDGGYSYEDSVKFLGSPGKYYSFDFKGYHFIVLFGFDLRPEAEVAGYPRNIGREQQQWLINDIDSTDLPVILASHNGVDLDCDEENGSLKEGIYIRRILERANEKAGYKKIRLFLSGHYHMDFLNVYNGIPYLQINSMSNMWLGHDYALERPGIGKEVYEKYKILRYTAPYKDPLWALITINPDGEIRIKGRRSEFIGPSPAEMGWNDRLYPSVPWISDRAIPL